MSEHLRSKLLEIIEAAGLATVPIVCTAISYKPVISDQLKGIHKDQSDQPVPPLLDFGVDIA